MTDRTDDVKNLAQEAKAAARADAGQALEAASSAVEQTRAAALQVFNKINKTAPMRRTDALLAAAAEVKPRP